MISIPVDCPGIIVATKSNKPANPINPSNPARPASPDIRATDDVSLPTWAIPLIYSFVSLLIVSFVAYVYHDLSGDIMKVQTSIGDVTKNLQAQQISIAKLETSVSIILKKPQYESNAKAAGFQNPQIVLANLQPQMTFESRTAGQKGDYFISYTVLSYDPVTGSMHVKFDAQLPNRMIYKDNIIIFHIKAGEVVELTQYFREKSAPRIYLQVLDIPVKNQAILAIGPKSDENAKHS